MAWPIETWTSASDWQAAATASAFWEAIAERQKAIGTSPYTIFPAAGADVQYIGASAPTGTTDKFSWALLQGAAYNLAEAGKAATAARWVMAHDADGTPRATDYYDGETAFDFWPDFATMMKTVHSDVAKTTFRAATTWPVDGEGDDDWTNRDNAAYAYRTIQAGDIIGPWIMQDLQDLLNLMLWTFRGELDGDPVDFVGNDAEDYYASSGSPVAKATSALAWADAVASLAPLDDDDFEEKSRNPMHIGIMNLSGSGYTAKIYAYRAYAKLTSIPTSPQRLFDFYALSRKPYPNEAENEWDDNSDDVIEDAYSLWESGTSQASPAATVYSSGPLGAVTDPTQPSDPLTNPGDRHRGWSVDQRWDLDDETDCACIIRWQFTYKA